MHEIIIYRYKRIHHNAIVCKDVVFSIVKINASLTESKILEIWLTEFSFEASL